MTKSNVSLDKEVKSFFISENSPASLRVFEINDTTDSHNANSVVVGSGRGRIKRDYK